MDPVEGEKTMKPTKEKSVSGMDQVEGKTTEKRTKKKPARYMDDVEGEEIVKRTKKKSATDMDQVQDKETMKQTKKKSATNMNQVDGGKTVKRTKKKSSTDMDQVEGEKTAKRVKKKSVSAKSNSSTSIPKNSDKDGNIKTKAMKVEQVFQTRGLTDKQYAKWKPLRKETEEFLKRIFESNTNRLLISKQSEADYETSHDILHGLTSSFMDGLEEAKFPKPATVNIKQLKEKTVQLESQLAANTELYDRIQAAHEEYERQVEQLETQKKNLEESLSTDELTLSQHTHLNPVLREVLASPSLPDLHSLDEKSNPAFVNRTRLVSQKNFFKLKRKCEEIGEFVDEAAGESSDDETDDYV